MKTDRAAKAPMETGESVPTAAASKPSKSRDKTPTPRPADLSPLLLRGSSRASSHGSSPEESEAKPSAAKLRQLPETDGERMQSLKDALQKGSYQVSPEQTAEAIISELEVRAEPPGEAKAGRNPAAAAGPLKLYAQRESRPAKRKQSASRDSCADQFGEDSGASRKPAGSDQMDSSG
jgi:anti-sigma28 factor (negative regulator of flagellin synthesis)